MLYYPIPQSESDSKTVSNFIMGGCDANTRRDFSATAVASVSKSTSQRNFEPISVQKETYRDQSGKWSSIKASGLIKMTPMKVIDRKVNRSLGKVILDKHHQALTHDSRQTSRKGGVCTACTVKERNYAHAQASITYLEQGDLSYWRDKYPGAPFFHLTGGFDSAKLEKLKSEAYAELFQAYNLGEEIYELRESLSMLVSLLKRGALLIQKSQKALSLALRKGGVPAAASAWMEFRYGIMPIMYSIQDVMKLLDSSGVFQTTRRTLYPEPGKKFVKPSVGSFFFEEGIDSSVIRITTKGRWASPRALQLDRINLNIVTTAATVYPYALVVRWFFNVNSWLDAQLKSYTTTALQYEGCVSVRTSRKVATFFTLRHDSTSTLVDYGNSTPCGPGYYGTYGPYVLGGPSEHTILLQSEEENSYERTLYKPTDTKLVYSPYLSWQRLVDALIMGTGLVSNILRSIK